MKENRQELRVLWAEGISSCLLLKEKMLAMIGFLC